MGHSCGVGCFKSLQPKRQNFASQHEITWEILIVRVGKDGKGATVLQGNLFLVALPPKETETPKQALQVPLGWRDRTSHKGVCARALRDASHGGVPLCPRVARRGQGPRLAHGDDGRLCLSQQQSERFQNCSHVFLPAVPEDWAAIRV